MGSIVSSRSPRNSATKNNNNHSPKFVYNKFVSIEKDDENKQNESVIEQIENVIKDIDEDNNGLIDYEEFVEFLAHYELDYKFNKIESRSIFTQFVEENSPQSQLSPIKKEASIDTFITALCHVLADHPDYGARRAIYRVLKRVLKAVKTKKKK